MVLPSRVIFLLFMDIYFLFYTVLIKSMTIPVLKYFGVDTS